MSPPLKDYFHYSNSERKGVIALLLILGIVFLYYLYIQFRPIEVDVSDAKFNVEIVKYTKRSYNPDSKNKYPQNKNSNDFSKNELFTFNPNEIGVEEWKQLGFSPKQAASIEKYKNAGATFKVKSDLKKLFMVDAKKYLELEPFINLPTPKTIKKNTKYYSKNTNTISASKIDFIGC